MADELLSRLAELEDQFPRGLRATRPYGREEFVWRGPGFASKGSPQRLRNPIHGGMLELGEGQTPEMYLSGVNAMVEAKARAQANVIRGWNSEEAASKALAGAWGVDPEVLKGVPHAAARGVIEGHRARAAEDKAEGERIGRDERAKADEQRTRMDMHTAMNEINPEIAAKMSGIKDPRIAQAAFSDKLGMFQQDEERRLEEYQQRLSESQTGAFTRELQRLEQMPPEQAEREAATRLSPYLKPDQLASVVGRFQARADDVRAQQKVGDVATERANKEKAEGFKTNVIAHLRAVPAVAMTFGKGDTQQEEVSAADIARGGAAPSEGEVPKLRVSISKKIALLQQALANVADYVPDWDPGSVSSEFGDLNEGLYAKEDELAGIARNLDQVAIELEKRMRERMGGGGRSAAGKLFGAAGKLLGF
jgi:hypothetical protein